MTPDLIRNLHDPDWSQAVSITAEQLSTGYTAPGRGIVVGWVMASSGDVYIKVNSVAVAASTWKEGAWASYPAIQVPVNKNDVMTVTPAVSSGRMNMSFVPYKAQ